MQKTAVSNTAQRIVLEHDVGIEVIPLGKIEVDVQYQRRLSRGKVRQIVNNWDNRAAGSLLVSWRQNDQIVVIDGQHRLAAMRQLHIHKATCQVLYGLTLSEEAALFALCNTARATPGALDVFKARLIAGDSTALRLNQVLEEEGVAIDFTNHNLEGDRIRCIAELEAISRRGSGKGHYDPNSPAPGLEDVRAVLRIVRLSWPEMPDGKRSIVLGGIGVFWRHYCNEISVEEVARKLSGISPKKIVAEARETATLIGGSPQTSVALMILKAVNHGKRTGRLPNKIALSPE